MLLLAASESHGREPRPAPQVPRIAEVAVGLPENYLEDLLACWGRLSAAQLTRMIETVQQYITLHLYEAQALDPEVSAGSGLPLLPVARRAGAALGGRVVLCCTVLVWLV